VIEVFIRAFLRRGHLPRRWSGTGRGIRSDAVAVSPLALDENLNLVVGQCPLCPRKRTFSEAAQMSAKCQKRTFEARLLLIAGCPLIRNFWYLCISARSVRRAAG